jgi:magnesium-transporting ATPase (P-type)
MKNHLIYWGNIIIPSLSIICGYFYFRMRDDFVYNPVPRLTVDGFYTLCQTTTIVFLLVQVPFALNGFFLYNNGRKFKEPFYRNYILLIVVILNCAADIFFFFKTESLRDFLGLVPIGKDSGGVLIVITIGFCIISYLFNWWV